MNQSYWDGVSENYSEEVLSVFHHDTLNLVKDRIHSAALDFPGGRAADLGCGVGTFTPALAESFRQVDACDLSPIGVAATRDRCQGLENVSVHQVDLSTAALPFGLVDFAICINVLIMPSLDERLRAWRCITNQINRGGKLLLVVPSSESVQMELLRAVDTHISDGVSCEAALANGHNPTATPQELQQGVHQLDGLSTKHYLRAELEEMLPAHELDIQEVTKIEYPSEIDGNPNQSWDWLVQATRR